jgi:hypothetical protein
MRCDEMRRRGALAEMGGWGLKLTRRWGESAWVLPEAAQIIRRAVTWPDIAGSPAGPTRPSRLHGWVISVPLSACRRDSVYNMTFSVQTLVAAASHQPRIPTRHRRSDSQEPRPCPIHDQPVPKLTVRNWIRRDTRLVETEALLDNWNGCAGSVCSGARRVWRRCQARRGRSAAAASRCQCKQERKEKKGTLLRVTSQWAGRQVGRWADGQPSRRPPSDRGRLQGEREPGRYKAQARERHRAGETAGALMVLFERR